MEGNSGSWQGKGGTDASANKSCLFACLFFFFFFQLNNLSIIEKMLLSLSDVLSFSKMF